MSEMDAALPTPAIKGAPSMGETSAAAAAALRPTRVRHVVLLLLIIHYGNTYVERLLIAGAAPVIKTELGLTNVMMGFVFSAFSIAYIIFQLPTGWLADRFGPRKVLTGIVAWWCVFTMATATALNVTMLMVFRFFFGAGQAGAFPSATRALTRWLPSSERGFAQGITHSASRFAGAITPGIVALTVVRFGWRWAFVVIGGLGMVWAVVWYWYYRDLPEEHPRVNAAELAIIHASQGPRDAKGKVRKTVPWSLLLKSPNMWYICLGWWGHSYMFWIYLTWFPTFLLEHHGFSLANAGMLAGLPLLAGSAANTIGGWWSDRLVKTRGLRYGRRAVAIIGFIGAIIGTVLGVLVTDPFWAVLLLTLAVFGLELTVGVSWAVPIDVGGDFSGTVSALMNTFGQSGGALSPIVFGSLVQYTGSWTLPFLIASGVLVGSIVVWMKIDPEKSVVS